jgi:transposase
VVQARQAWRAEHQEAAVDLSHYYFLDECGSRTDLTRLFGRAAPGERVVEGVPAGHYCQTTLLGALNLAGETACMTLDGAVDSESFLVYVQWVLCPVLRPGDIVVADNLSSHLSPKIRRAIEARGARLKLLPAYSPDLNPIEKMWSKVKAYLRKAKARTVEALEQAIKAALASVSAEDARGWFESCGYGHTHG